MRRIGEDKLLERLHLGEMRFLNPACYGVAFSLFDFCPQQHFQITEMTLLLADGLLRYLRKLPADGRQPQLLGILPDGGLLCRALIAAPRWWDSSRATDRSSSSLVADGHRLVRHRSRWLHRVRAFRFVRPSAANAPPRRQNNSDSEPFLALP